MVYGTAHKTLGLLLALTLLFTAFSALPSAAAEQPAAEEALLESGTEVNARMKSLAAGTDTGYWTETEDIKAIRMADSLPAGFVPSAANTVSAADSAYPVYIVFDNADDKGIMYFYTEAGRIVMSPYSQAMFARNAALADISGIAGWDASRVQSMNSMFMGDKSLPDALALRDWDTSGVTDMSYLFSNDISLVFADVSGWNTGNVTRMTSMFQVGESWKSNGQLREIVGIENLDVSNVTDMTCMFYGAGQMSFYNIGDWNVSKVESMNHMFCDNRSLRSLDLSKWDVSSLRTICCMFDDNVSLRTIGDVSRWNTVNLIDAGAWMNNMPSFIGDDTGTLDLSGWDTRNLKSATEMFCYTRIHTIDMTGWTFDAVTNDPWEGTGTGYYYETGNNAGYKGLDIMFKDSSRLTRVFLSQEGLDSFNRAVERGVSTEDMWHKCKTSGFTVR